MLGGPYDNGDGSWLAYRRFGGGCTRGQLFVLEGDMFSGSTLCLNLELTATVDVADQVLLDSTSYFPLNMEYFIIIDDSLTTRRILCIADLITPLGDKNPDN
jgi:hypothetical protein